MRNYAEPQGSKATNSMMGLKSKRQSRPRHPQVRRPEIELEVITLKLQVASPKPEESDRCGVSCQEGQDSPQIPPSASTLSLLSQWLGDAQCPGQASVEPICRISRSQRAGLHAMDAKMTSRGVQAMKLRIQLTLI